MEWKRKKYDINFGYLVYEGEFLNGRSNGKGKLYKNGKLFYEGEFKNNSRNGKGKEYDKNGNIIFDGEYENDWPIHKEIE